MIPTLILVGFLGGVVLEGRPRALAWGLALGSRLWLLALAVWGDVHGVSDYASPLAFGVANLGVGALLGLPVGWLLYGRRRARTARGL